LAQFAGKLTRMAQFAGKLTRMAQFAGKGAFIWRNFPPKRHLLQNFKILLQLMFSIYLGT
jgi:hypothetical protein